MNFHLASYVLGVATPFTIAALVILFLKYRWELLGRYLRFHMLYVDTKNTVGHVIWMQLVYANDSHGYGTFLKDEHLTAYQLQVGQGERI